MAAIGARFADAGEQGIGRCDHEVGIVRVTTLPPGLIRPVGGAEHTARPAARVRRSNVSGRPLARSRRSLSNIAAVLTSTPVSRPPPHPRECDGGVEPRRRTVAGTQENQDVLVRSGHAHLPVRAASQSSGRGKAVISHMGGCCG